MERIYQVVLAFGLRLVPATWYFFMVKPPCAFAEAYFSDVKIY